MSQVPPDAVEPERGPLARAEVGRVVRFVLVGGVLFAIDLVVFMALVSGIDLAVGWAQVVSVTVRTAVGFVLHKWFTFRGDTDDSVSTTAKQGVAYLVQGAVNVPISAAVVIGCVWLLGGWALGGKVLSEFVMVAEVYLLYRFFVYGSRWFGKGG